MSEIQESGPLAGQIAIVTGAGSGIGQAIARRLAARGARVLAVDLSEQGLAETVGASGRMAGHVQNLLDEGAPETISAAAIAAFGAPTILVNNAGIGAAKALHLSDDAELARYLDLNLLALMRMSRGFLAAVQAPARIVNIASIYGLVGATNSAPYSASKAGVIGLTRQMAADYGPRDIRVNAVAPGLIVTPLTESRLQANRAWEETMTDSTPLGRLGRPEDIAAAVAFLCSADADYITGQVLTVDGGWSATRFFAGGDF